MPPQLKRPPFVGFTDLHGFKDYIGSVMLRLPDYFIQRDYLGPEEQMTFERAFEGLHYGVSLLEAERGMPEVVAECLGLIDKAHDLYRRGDKKEGFGTLQKLSDIFDQIPTE